MNIISNSDNWKDAIVRSSLTMADAIASLNISGLQIVLVADDHDVLLGTITDGDIRRALLNAMTLETPVVQIMNKNSIKCSESMSLSSSSILMVSNHINHLPVVDSGDVLVGLRVREGFLASKPRDNLMVIMAGGAGRRLSPLTDNCPKPMLKVGEKPILQLIIENAISHGLRNFVISVNYLGDMIKEYFQDGSWLGVSINYVQEKKPLGTAGALTLLNIPNTHPIIITNGDILTEIDYNKLIDFHLAHNSTATMVVREHIIKNPFGVVNISGIDIVGFEEKPLYKSMINAGIYILNPEIISLFEKDTAMDMPDVFSALGELGYKSVVFPLHEKWLDVGRKNDLIMAQAAAEG